MKVGDYVLVGGDWVGRITQLAFHPKYHLIWRLDNTSPMALLRHESVLTKFDVGWAAFKKWHDFSTTVRAGRLMAEYSFRSLGATALFGSTPVKNRAAVLAAGRVGFELYGPVPNYTVWEGEPCAVMISALTKERWERIKEGMTHGATESGNTSRADSNAGCAAKSAA